MHLSLSSSSLSFDVVHDAGGDASTAVAALQHQQQGRQGLSGAFPLSPLRAFDTQDPGGLHSSSIAQHRLHEPKLAHQRADQLEAPQHDRLQDATRGSRQEQLSEKLQQDVPEHLRQLWQRMAQQASNSQPMLMQQGHQHQEAARGSGALHHLSQLAADGHCDGNRKESVRQSAGLIQLWANLRARPISAGHALRDLKDSQRPRSKQAHLKATSQSKEPQISGVTSTMSRVLMRPASAPAGQISLHGKPIGHQGGMQSIASRITQGPRLLGHAHQVLLGETSQQTGSSMVPATMTSSLASSSWVSSKLDGPGPQLGAE